jgi:glycosyltransferase involved in cell wall biosynthesis
VADEGPASGPKRTRVALVVPTKDKMRHLAKTLPDNARLGFDEVIVVDSSTRERQAVEDLCNAAGARYHFAPLDRLGARNKGVELSAVDWVCVLDDDILLTRFDLGLFRKTAQDLDFMIGGWGGNTESQYAWIFRRSFFLDTLHGYDPDITGGDDLDITLRAQKLGRGKMALNLGLYDSKALGLAIAEEYPERWIRNKVLYSLTFYPLLRRHPFLITRFLLSDGWRAKRLLKGESPAKLLFESFMERAGLVYGPAYSLLRKRRRLKGTA